MKIRSDFVTNSSSSSYVIAVKKDITEEQIEEIVERNMDDIAYLAKCHDIAICDIKQSLREFIRTIASYPDLDLESWGVCHGEASNSYYEDNLTSLFIYDCGLTTNENIRISSGGY